MMLELAESPYDLADEYSLQDEFSLQQAPAESVDELYLYVPPTGNWPGGYMREDLFDDLPDEQWGYVMAQLEPYQEDKGGMSIWPFSTKKGRERRKKRREKRHQRKLEKIQARGEAGTGIGGLFKSIGSMFGGGGAEAVPDTRQLPPPPPSDTILGMSKPVFFTVAGLTLVLIGGIVYSVSRKRRR